MVRTERSRELLPVRRKLSAGKDSGNGVGADTLNNTPLGDDCCDQFGRRDIKSRVESLGCCWGCLYPQGREYLFRCPLFDRNCGTGC